MQRRHVLRTVALGAALGLAGCTEGEPATGGQPTTSPTPAPTETATPGSGGGGGTPDPTTSPTDGATETPTSTSAPAVGGAPSLGDLEVQFESNFRFSAVSSQFDGTIRGAWSGGNYVSRVEMDGTVVESYVVDGDTYVVADGSCSAIPSSAGGPTGIDTEELLATNETEENVEQYGSVVATGTTTIDGEAMYVFELQGGQASVESDVTYYVNVETERLRRVETQGFTLDYYDWGAVDPITAPC